MRRKFIIYSILGLGIAWTSITKATVAIYLSGKQLTKQADVIVLAKVISIKSEWNKDRTTIYTYTSLKVNEYIKGKGPEKIVIRQIGGKVGEIEVFVPGNARFDLGEEVFLFLEKGSKYYYVMGMAQGKFSVKKDKLSKEKILVREMGNLGIVEFNKEGKMLWKVDQPIEPPKLNQIIAEIKRILKINLKSH